MDTSGNISYADWVKVGDVLVQKPGWGIRNVPLPILSAADLEVFISPDGEQRVISFVGTVVAVEYVKRMAFIEVGKL